MISKSKPITVSYYTKGTHYEKEALDLIDSCNRFSIDYHIMGIDNTGSWEKNCLLKPSFIQEMLLKFQRPVIWVDADALYVKPTSFFEKLTCDIAATTHYHLPDQHPSKILSGTLYFKPTPASFMLLKDWEKRCAKGGWDQIHLRDALFSNYHHLTFFPLPTIYTMIFDKIASQEEANRTVILHFQASRYFKKVVDGEALAFDGLTSKEAAGFHCLGAAGATDKQVRSTP